MTKLIINNVVIAKPPETYKDLVKEISTIGNTINILVQTTDKLDIEQAETVVLLLEKIFEKLNEMG